MFFVKKGNGSLLSLPVRRALAPARDRYQGLPFEIGFPDRERMRFGLDAPEVRVRFETWRAVYDTLARGSLGLGEAYVRGDFTVQGDLEDALTALGTVYAQMGGERWLEAIFRSAPLRPLVRERADVEHHYGRGDDFYRFYLDAKLQYSCGYFRSPHDTLDQAQEQKIVHTLEKLALRPGQRLLDIGCGWGHLMFHAAEVYGVACTGVTLCENQARYIEQQAAARRLPVRARVMNYQELDERVGWDRIVSVGMMCHVGERRIDQFWDKVKALLAPGGVCLLHCIAKMRESAAVDPFVEKHVFPGYWFNSLEGMTARAAARDLDVLDVENLRRHYALTAHHWRRNFLQRWDEIKRAMGCDEAFMKTWEFYLALVVAGFRRGHLHLVQMLMSNGVQDDYPLTRDFLYARPAAPAPLRQPPARLVAPQA